MGRFLVSGARYRSCYTTHTYLLFVVFPPEAGRRVMSNFVHLHTHSHYSLLDGLGKIPELVTQAKALGMDALALTDHGVLYGAIEFYKECKAQGIKPIIGMETYVALGSRFDKRAQVDNDYYHLILLATSYQGYKNLLQLTTLAHLEGYYYKPRVDWELLERFHEGLIALSACLGGQMAREIVGGASTARLKEIVAQHQRVFGVDNYFFELQHRPSIPKQQLVNSTLITLGKELGVPVVATNDLHYIHSEDADAQDVLLCLQTKSQRSDTKRMNMLGEDYSLLPPAKMEELFSYIPEAMSNTVKIADRCAIEIPLRQIILPEFPLPAGVSAQQALEQLCEQGLPRRYGHAINPSIRERLTYELGVIAKTGFASYFLIVADFVNWAKAAGIMVGPGRGSAAGSIVSYLLNITNVDPVHFKLFFERFLNPERISMPDIDLDFADRRRDEVLRYVEEKYGKDHVAQIITFGTMAARAAVRDCGRVLGMSYAICDRIAKLIPMFTGLADALEQVPELKALYTQDADARLVLDTAKKVEHVARHSSTHACGVVISDKPLVEYMPLQFASSDDRSVISQYELHAVEDLGILKMDFLGLRNLTILEDALRIIHETRSVTIDLEKIPMDDAPAFDLLQRGDTTGVFQLESSGMKRYLRELKPTVLEDIIAMVALYRPGPMEFIPDFIASKRGLKKIEYLHPKLEPILDYTYGIAVYQEQVLQIARDIAGFSLGEADVLRKAIGKKIKHLLMEQREKFVKGAVEHGVSKSIAQKLFDFTEPFARYGFNRAHAACYGLIAYQTAYLKANYPVEFMAALMGSELGDVERIAVLVKECRQMDLAVLPPDINESGQTFNVVVAEGKPAIRFGMAAVKNVGEGVVAGIVAERTLHGPFLSLGDFLSRLGVEHLNKKSLESLAKAGALDRLGDRSLLVGNVEKMLKFLRSSTPAEGSSAQSSLLFMMDPAMSAPVLHLDPIAPERRETVLAWEKELLGLYVSEHPLSAYQGQLATLSTPIASIVQYYEQQGAVIGGMVSTVKLIYTKKGEKMVFAQFEDLHDTIELIVFPSVHQQSPEVWVEGNLLLVRGKVTLRSGTPQLICERALPITTENLKTLIDKMATRFGQDKSV